MSSPPVPIRDQVRLWGPESDVRLDDAEAIAYCRHLAGGHYENFSVLSSLVPRALRDDFAIVYSFCRWSDDLSDEAFATEALLPRFPRTYILLAVCLAFPR